MNEDSILGERARLAMCRYTCPSVGVKAKNRVWTWSPCLHIVMVNPPRALSILACRNIIWWYNRRLSTLISYLASGCGQWTEKSIHPMTTILLIVVWWHPYSDMSGINFLSALFCVSKAASAFILEIAAGLIRESRLMWYLLWGGILK